MRRFWEFIVILTATALAGLIVVALQNQVSTAFNSDRLRGEYYVGPWHPYPAKGSRSNQADAEFFAQARSPFSIGRLEVTNPGRHEVTGILVILPFEVEAIARFQNEEKTVIHDASRVEVDPLQPGEFATIFVFRAAGADFADYARIKTYSSQGPIVIQAHSYLRRTFDDPILLLIESYVFPAIIGILGVSVLLCIAYAGIQTQYIRELLSDKGWYIRQQARFVADPRLFKLTLKSDASFPSESPRQSEANETTDELAAPSTDEPSLGSHL